MAALVVALTAARAACDGYPIGNTPATAIALRGTTIATVQTFDKVDVCVWANSMCTARAAVTPNVAQSTNFGAAVALSADGNYILVGGNNRAALHHYNGTDWNHTKTFSPPESAITDYGAEVALAANGINATICSPANNTCYVVDCLTNGGSKFYNAKTAAMAGPSQFATGDSGDRNGKGRVAWDDEHGNLILVWVGTESYEGLGSHVALSEDGTILAAGNTIGSIYVYPRLAALKGGPAVAVSNTFLAATKADATAVWRRQGQGWAEYATIGYSATKIALYGDTLLLANDNEAPRVYDLDACGVVVSDPADHTPTILGAVAGVTVAAAVAGFLAR